MRGGFITEAQNFLKIPGSPLAYWMSKSFQLVFDNAPLSSFADARIGMVSGDNERFLRLWFEIKINDTCFDATDIIYAVYTGKKWFPLQKGGGKRYWYGNLEYVINYQNDGYELKFNNSIGDRVRSHNYNGEKTFLPGITWNSIGTTELICRISEKGFVYDAGGPLCTVNKSENTYYFLGLLKSKVAQAIYQFINPTINYTPGTLLSLPIIIGERESVIINEIVDKNIDVSRKDWNDFETSWNFKKHPLI